MFTNPSISYGFKLVAQQKAASAAGLSLQQWVQRYLESLLEREVLHPPMSTAKLLDSFRAFLPWGTDWDDAQIESAFRHQVWNQGPCTDEDPLRQALLHYTDDNAQERWRVGGQPSKHRYANPQCIGSLELLVQAFLVNERSGERDVLAFRNFAAGRGFPMNIFTYKAIKYAIDTAQHPALGFAVQAEHVMAHAASKAP
jgi:hypothetical protein